MYSIGATTKPLPDSTVAVYGTAADSWKYATERSFSDNWRSESPVLAYCIVRHAEGHAAGRTSGKRSLRDRTPLELRADIPALQDDVYLNFGVHGPSPKYVVDATDEFVRAHECDAPVADDPYDTAFRAFDRARETVASFIGEAVAESFDIAPPTFHQHLQKAQRKVFDLLLSTPVHRPRG